MAQLSVILVAAGKSSRFQNAVLKKPFVELNGQPVWLHSAKRFREHDVSTQIILVLAPDDREMFLSSNAHRIEELGLILVNGGEERADSVEKAIALLDLSSNFVIVHDAARPCFDLALLHRVLAAGFETGAAIPAVPVHSTMKRSLDSRTIQETVDRTNLYLAQTPQVFRTDWFLQAYRNRKKQRVTDDAQVLELAGYPIAIVDGSPLNIKITTKEDLDLVESILSTKMKSS